MKMILKTYNQWCEISGQVISQDEIRNMKIGSILVDNTNNNSDVVDWDELLKIGHNCLIKYMTDASKEIKFPEIIWLDEVD